MHILIDRQWMSNIVYSLEPRVADAARDSVPDAARLATHVRSISTWDSMQPTRLANLGRAHVNRRIAGVRGSCWCFRVREYLRGTRWFRGLLVTCPTFVLRSEIADCCPIQWHACNNGRVKRAMRQRLRLVLVAPLVQEQSFADSDTW